jgi:hypothetical protein
MDWGPYTATSELLLLFADEEVDFLYIAFWRTSFGHALGGGNASGISSSMSKSELESVTMLMLMLMLWLFVERERFGDWLVRLLLLLSKLYVLACVRLRELPDWVCDTEGEREWNKRTHLSRT